MRWFIAKCIFTGCIFLSNVALAQPTADDSLILSSGCGQFQIVLGRVQMDAHHYKKVRLSAPETEANDEEFVCVTARKGIPSLHYLRQVGKSRVTIDVMDINAVRMESRILHPSGVTESILIQQPADGDISLISKLGEREQTVTTASFWHLLVEEPTLFEQQVAPMLALIMKGLDVAKFESTLDRRMQQIATEGPFVTEAEIKELVAALGSPQRQQRSAAHRKLTSYGLAILPIIERLRPETLDAEQKHRIADLKNRLKVSRPDTPKRIAAWLSTDRAYWTVASKGWEGNSITNADRYVAKVHGQGLAGGEAVNR